MINKVLIYKKNFLPSGFFVDLALNTDKIKKLLLILFFSSISFGQNDGNEALQIHNNLEKFINIYICVA